MQSAAPKVYISKRQLAKYSEQRASMNAPAQSQAAPQVPRSFQEDLQPIQEVPAEETKVIQIEPAKVSKKKAAEPKAKKSSGSFFSRVSSALGLSSKKNVPPESTESLAQKEEELDRNVSCEELDSDELEGDLNLSDDESGVAARTVLRANKSQKPASEKIAQEFDTNVFKVSFANLQDRGELAAGDAVFCTSCKAVFNKNSALETRGDQQIWRCEFCNTENEVQVDPEEMPSSEQTTYLLEAAAQVEAAAEEVKQAEKKPSDKISVVFCIDHSGSMSSYGRLEQCK